MGQVKDDKPDVNNRILTVTEVVESLITKNIELLAEQERLINEKEELAKRLRRIRDIIERDGILLPLGELFDFQKGEVKQLPYIF
ncbi:MAG: hypothetical protein ACFFG0_07045 [Candidatus Thorarchaeota archaeon]